MSEQSKLILKMATKLFDEGKLSKEDFETAVIVAGRDWVEKVINNVNGDNNDLPSQD